MCKNRPNGPNGPNGPKRPTKRDQILLAMQIHRHPRALALIHPDLRSPWEAARPADSARARSVLSTRMGAHRSRDAEVLLVHGLQNLAHARVMHGLQDLADRGNVDPCEDGDPEVVVIWSNFL